MAESKDLPQGFAHSEVATPGVGKVTVHANRKLGPEDHFAAFSVAFQKALDNIGRAPGNYHVKIELSASVHVKNPGSVIEYIATVI
jgi:hypothetical protein